MKNGQVKHSGPAVSPDGKRRTAVLLEVLAGVRTPQQAAEALSLSLPGFYQLEDRALAQLQVGCEVRPRGRQVTSDSKMAMLAREVERLQKEVSRYQTLVRLTQRTVGVPPAATPKPTTGKRRQQADGACHAPCRAAACGGERRGERRRRDRQPRRGRERAAGPGWATGSPRIWLLNPEGIGHAWTTCSRA